MGSDTPYLYMNLDGIQELATPFLRTFGEASTFYALKANPNPHVTRFITSLGIGLEISSVSELELAVKCGVPGCKIISGNPVKTPEFVKRAHQAGIRYFVVDSYQEIDKICNLAPGAPILVRISVDNGRSRWPLVGKFGAIPNDVQSLLRYANTCQLTPIGLTFHVGSQNESLDSWEKAVRLAYAEWRIGRDNGIELSTINLGGGFPARYGYDIPDRLELVEGVFSYARNKFPSEVELHVEPGRMLVGEAGVFVASVIGKAVRDGDIWIYLDIGVYNGLFDALHGVAYPITTLKPAERQTYIVAGPTCDGIDVIARNQELPCLEVGDKVLIQTAGAYTIACSTEFNGFKCPRVVAGAGDLFDHLGSSLP